jgi:hypothetical protein
MQSNLKVISVDDYIDCGLATIGRYFKRPIGSVEEFMQVLAEVLYDIHNKDLNEFFSIMSRVQTHFSHDPSTDPNQVIYAALHSTRLRCIKGSVFNRKTRQYDCEPHEEGDCPIDVTAPGLPEDHGIRQDWMVAAKTAKIIKDLHRKLGRECGDLYWSFKPTIHNAEPGCRMLVDLTDPGDYTQALLKSAKADGFQVGDKRIPFSEITDYMKSQLEEYGKAWEEITMDQRPKVVYELTCYMPHIYTAIDVFDIDIKTNEHLLNAVEWSYSKFQEGPCPEAVIYPKLVKRSWLSHVYFHFGLPSLFH